MWILTFKFKLHEVNLLSAEVACTAIYTAKVGYIVSDFGLFVVFFNCGNVLSSWDVSNFRKACNLLGVTDSHFSKIYVHVMNLGTMRHNDSSY